LVEQLLGLPKLADDLPGLWRLRFHWASPWPSLANREAFFHKDWLSFFRVQRPAPSNENDVPLMIETDVWLIDETAAILYIGTTSIHMIIRGEAIVRANSK